MALPPPLASSRQRGRASGIGTIVLGVVIAIGVALLFIAVIGAGIPHGAGLTGYRNSPIRTTGLPNSCSPLAKRASIDRPERVPAQDDLRH